MTTKTPEPYFPPLSLLGVGHNSLFGFEIGAKFESHAAAYDLLAREAFQPHCQEVINPDVVRQLIYTRNIDGAPSASLYIKYNHAKALDKVALAFGGGPCDNPAAARSSARRVRNFARSVYGIEQAHLDRIDEWALGSMSSTDPEVAFAAIWTSEGDPLRCITATSAEELSRIAEGLSEPYVTLAVSSRDSLVVGMFALHAPESVGVETSVSRRAVS